VGRALRARWVTLDQARKMKGKQRLIRGIILIAIAGVGYWQKDRFSSGEQTQSDQSPSPKFEFKLPGSSSKPSSTATKKQGAYDVLEGCRLVDHRNNDGDSFFIQHGKRKIELRVYFVDCPEKYLSDDFRNQRERVAEQGREMGGMSPQQTVAIGQQAKKYVNDLLSGKTFTVYTYWEEVYSGDRYYGFVRIPGSKKFLGEELVARGLARIHTKGPGSKQKPVPTPDRKSFFQHRDNLYGIERSAKSAKRGAWGVR